MNREMIIVLDFGGQYNQLIARRVRECSVYCEVHPYDMSLEKIKEMNPKGIIFTGGPDVVFEDGWLPDTAVPADAFAADTANRNCLPDR